MPNKKTEKNETPSGYVQDPIHGLVPERPLGTKGEVVEAPKSLAVEAESEK